MGGSPGTKLVNVLATQVDSHSMTAKPQNSTMTQGGKNKAQAFRDAIESIDIYLQTSREQRTLTSLEHMEYSFSVLTRYVSTIIPTISRADWTSLKQLLGSVKLLHEIVFPGGAQQTDKHQTARDLFSTVGPGMISLVDNRTINLVEAQHVDTKRKGSGMKEQSVGMRATNVLANKIADTMDQLYAPAQAAKERDAFERMMVDSALANEAKDRATFGDLEGVGVGVSGSDSSHTLPKYSGEIKQDSLSKDTEEVKPWKSGAPIHKSTYDPLRIRREGDVE